MPTAVSIFQAFLVLCATFGALSFQEVKPPTGQDLSELDEALDPDDECSAGSCALNALQFKAVAAGARPKPSATDLSPWTEANFTNQTLEIQGLVNQTLANVTDLWAISNETSLWVFGTTTPDESFGAAPTTDKVAGELLQENRPKRNSASGIPPRQARVKQLLAGLQDQLDDLWSSLADLNRMSSKGLNYMNQHKEPAQPVAEPAPKAATEQDPPEPTALADVTSARRRRAGSNSSSPANLSPAEKIAAEIQADVNGQREQLAEMKELLVNETIEVSDTHARAKSWRGLA